MNARSRSLLGDTRDIRRIALLVLALAPAACAVQPMQDFTETFLVTDPVELFEIVVDRGSIQAVSYERSVVTLKRHTFGYPKDIGTPDYSVEDGVVRFEAHCAGRLNECTWDHLLELPYGVGFDIRMTEALIELGNLDRDVTAEFEFGEFTGSGLRSPNVSLTADSARISIEFAAVPEAVTIDVGAGDVTLTVPAGSYRCVLASGTGEVKTTGVTCDDAAAAILDVQLQTGDIQVTGATP